MVPTQVPIGPELVISLAVLVVVPIALLYIGYKLFQGIGAFREGWRDT